MNTKENWNQDLRNEVCPSYSDHQWSNSLTFDDKLRWLLGLNFWPDGRMTWIPRAPRNNWATKCLYRSWRVSKKRCHQSLDWSNDRKPKFIKFICFKCSLALLKLVPSKSMNVRRSAGRKFSRQVEVDNIFVEVDSLAAATCNRGKLLSQLISDDINDSFLHPTKEKLNIRGRSLERNCPLRVFFKMHSRVHWAGPRWKISLRKDSRLNEARCPI